MPTLTFLGSEGCPDCLEWNGVEFPVGKAIPLNMGKPLHRHMLAKAKGNPFFEVVDDDEIGVPVAIPDPEYHAFVDDVATDYVPVDDVEEMDKQTLRDTLMALGQLVDGRWSVETLREKLKEAYGNGTQEL